MTFQKYFMKYLTSNGMFEDQAEEALALLLESSPALKECWHKEIRFYDKHVIAIAKMHVKSTAV